jgi:ribosomal protein S18 acetylase RimI-like enzyme
MKIKEMTKKQLPAVSKVLAKAFEQFHLKRHGSDKIPRIRKEESTLPYLQSLPEGCFVAIEKRKIVGAIFSHLWGKFGWIGTFGVLPEYQGKGIGKALMVKVIDYLDKQHGVTSLALETMSRSAENIALYSKLGFRPAFHTMRLIQPIATNETKTAAFEEKLKKSNLSIQYYSKIDNKEDILTRCAWISSKIINGLDYRIEIEITDKYNLGETVLLLHDGFVIGFAICRTLVRYENDQDPYLDLKVLVMDPEVKERIFLDYLIYYCKLYGEKEGKTGLKLWVNSSYWVVYSYLLNNGFKLRSAIIRMIKFSDDIKAYDHSTDWLVNCSGLTM